MRIGADSLVLREGQLHELIAAKPRALTAKRDRVVHRARRRSRLDPLVDLPKDRLVMRDPILEPISHAAIIPLGRPSSSLARRRSARSEKTLPRTAE